MPFLPNRRPGRPRRAPAGLLAKAVAAGLAGLAGTAAPAAAQSAHSYLVFDARTGEVIDKHDAYRPWYPASVTKLMTAYVTFQAVRAGRLKLTSPVVMTAEAAVQPPSKMGFPVGTTLTVDNALKMIMVKSANDVAWALGEAVGGSKDAFVDEMNRTARRLGMTRTVWGNPNGLPDPSQYTNAHDLALLARALIREFPEHAGYFNLSGIQFGKRVIRNHNHLMDRFPGTDGMKTGFICASGYNVVATVTRGNRRLVAVVLGSPSARSRAEKAAQLFLKGFEGQGGLAALFGSRETLDGMQPGPEALQPVADIRDEVCGRNRRSVGEDADDLLAEAPAPDDGGIIRPDQQRPKTRKGAGGVAGSYLTARFDIGPPVKVWTGGADAAPPASAVAAAPAAVPAAMPVPKPAGTEPQVAALVEPARQPPAPGAIFAGAARSEPVVPVVQPQAGSATARAFGLFSNTPPATIPMPATGPQSGAGVAETLPPATGTPMVIAGPAPAATATAPRPAAQPIVAETWPIPPRKPPDLAKAARAAAARYAAVAHKPEPSAKRRRP